MVHFGVAYSAPIKVVDSFPSNLRSSLYIRNVTHLSVTCLLFYCAYGNVFLKKVFAGQPWWRRGLALPAAQGVIIETHLGLPAWSLLPPLPVSVSASLCVCLYE